MEPIIASRFHESILNTAMQRYGIAAGEIKLLDSFESFIYRFERSGGRFILRIGHSQRRSPDLIRGEVDWINYLAAGGVSVARAVHSAHGNLVETVSDEQDSEFLCTAFVHAPGEAPRRNRINDRIIRNYGRLIGKMHALSKSYQVSDPAWKRYRWDSLENSYAERFMPAKEGLVLEKYRQVVVHLQSLSCDADSFGMIHQDAHPGNFFVAEDDTLTLFDFDDCVYGHFIYDIAMVLFYTAINDPDPAAFTGRFMPVFLSGYGEENSLDPAWLAELPWFMKLREIDLFAAIHASEADGDNPDHPWSRMFMQGRRERIEQDIPVISFDWKSLAQYLSATV